MNTLTPVNKFNAAVVTLASLFLSILAFLSAAYGQETATEGPTHSHKQSGQAATDATLSNQLRALQSKVAALEAALKQNRHGAQNASGRQMGSMGGGQMEAGANMGAMSGMGRESGPGMRGMGMGKGMSAMGASAEGMMDQQMMQMMQMMQQMMEMKTKMKMMDMKMMGKGMGSDMSGTKGMEMGKGGMEMPGMKGMEMMGKKDMAMMGGKGMAGRQTPSPLPAFPGAPHIYHTGATGFFLDYPERITLTAEQQTALNEAKEKGLLEQSSFQGKIDDAEQELGALTASDQPDAEKIEAKIREIEKLRSDQRLAFIRSVGQAAGVLTDEQRKTLAGTIPPNQNATTTGDQN